MTTLVVLTAAPVLDLDGAAALVQARPDDDLTWISLAPDADAVDADHVAWLRSGVPGSTWRWELGELGRAERAAPLVEAGLAYPCGCDDARLLALATSTVEAGGPPRYDGACRRRPPAEVVRHRATGELADRVGAAGLADTRLDAALAIALALEARSFDRVVVEAALWNDARLASAIVQEVGGTSPDLRRAPWVVGPDGAPLWREEAPRTVADLRQAGLEPDGVRRFLARPRHLRAIPFDLEALDAANLAAIRALPRDDAHARLGALLTEGGIPTTTEELPRLWRAVSPRLTRFDRAVELLGFLAPELPVPAFDEHDREGLLAVGPTLLEADPRDGEAAQEVLVAAADPPDEIHDFRRIIRWALTAQEVAPPLITVWDLLGSSRALGRVKAAVAALGGVDDAESDREG